MSSVLPEPRCERGERGVDAAAAGGYRPAEAGGGELVGADRRR